jgi:hypothetical protein
MDIDALNHGGAQVMVQDEQAIPALRQRSQLFRPLGHLTCEQDLFRLQTVGPMVIGGRAQHHRATAHD